MKLKVGDIVTSVVELADESGIVIQVGTKLRIVAITPKVSICWFVDKYHDCKKDFLNMVRDNQVDNYTARIRADYCTIKKVKGE